MYLCICVLSICYRSDLLEFDFNLSKWSVVPAAGRRPRARYRATCVVHKNQMLLFGGHDGTRHLADTHIFDFETRIWTALVTDGTPPIPRDSHVSAVWNGSMYIFGGSSGSAMSDLHELQLPSKPSSAAKWRQLRSSSTDQPEPRFCHVAAVYQDSMYVFGGKWHLSSLLQHENCSELTCMIHRMKVMTEASGSTILFDSTLLPMISAFKCLHQH